MDDRAAEAEHNQAGLIPGLSQDADADAQGDDADVLDAAIGQEPLDVVLGQGQDDAEKA
ncbi:MAG TPA: hypothetical protein VLI39_20845 [Sedimentisphaerales bacterium]|nr:hypothetical protein [Sedimentisphaerales bacterium]